ncbi:MAG: 16S rRNA (uracil(1498)-N(3))-methyltransferase, partial [Candidatus Omnitrophica bacterium]|nr:16S rRNA (uracil(1498)-N(3))-methyltransferase [Candidatus Omnitrophota bacterium]
HRKGRILVFIGPEGDFTPEEATMALEAPNCRPVSLGRRVLKSDTAGLYVLSVLGYELDI